MSTAGAARGSKSPVLLANPDFYGTLAATRSLGEQGIPVYIADDSLLAVSRWSRHTTRSVRCPPLSRPARFIERLLDLGAREPGIVLYPTSDEATFLYALHHDALSRTYRMYQPSLDTVLHVLDKKRLYATARVVGMDVPDTWFPETDEDVERIGRDAGMPILIKPRTQAFSNSHSKGVIVADGTELVSQYRDFVRTTTYDQVVLDHFPEAPKAMLQRYMPEAAEQIYVLAAFVDRSGKHFVARSATKVFQRPRRLGIGLCFEDAALDPAVVEAARRLAKACGYFGLFQLEFIKRGEKYLLIDFNPRFYNQLAYDVARGLPLPALVYAAATGDDAEIERLVEKARTGTVHDLVFCNAFGLRMMLTMQRMAGRMTATEAAKWRRWRAKHRTSSIDPTVVAGDPLPGVADVAAQICAYARHPRSFLRKIVLDESS